MKTSISLRHKVWTGIGIFSLFLVQTFAFPFLPANKKTEPKDETIQIHHADRIFKDIAFTADGQVLVGNVHLSHSGMRLKCDSAVFYEASNSFMAYGKIRFTQGDTLSLTGDSIFYDGTSQFARVFHDVVMRHHKMNLYTDLLNYDRITGRGFYDTGGKIVDGTTVLTSQRGDYFTTQRNAIFNDDVLLVSNQKDSLITDSLHYNTLTKWAHATGPTNLRSGASHIYTTNGLYNTQTGKAHLIERPQLFNKGRKLTGDSLYYDKETGFSEAFYNIVFTDSTDQNNKNILMGDYGYYKEPIGEAMVTIRALAKNFSRDADTLYVHADTLRLYSYDLKTDSAYRILHGYLHVRAYREDVQAVCDSLVFNSKLKQLTLHRDPIAWTDNRQVLGEEITLFSNDSTIDSIYIDRQALLVESLPDSTLFNQVSGNVMQAYFRDGELFRAFVDGNAMLTNFPMEKDTTFLYHNYCEAPKLRVDVSNRKMRRFWASPNPNGKTYPIGMAPPEHTRLSNFAWFDYIRPLSPDDLFEWRPKSAATKLKERPRRQAPLQNLKRLEKKGGTQFDEPSEQPSETTIDNTHPTIIEPQITP